jgi:hypothetical protein
MLTDLKKFAMTLPKLFLKVVQVMKSNFGTKSGLNNGHEANILFDDVVETHACLQIK